MKRQPYFKNWRKIASVSFGLVYIFFILWLIFHTFQYVPPELTTYWFTIFIGYGLLNSLIFASADMRNKLFNVQFIKYLPRFFLYTIIGLVVFYIVLRLVDPFDYPLFTLIKSIPIWLMMIHAFVFSTTESVVWQGYLDEKIGHPWSELTAGIFHWGIWSGGALIVIPAASLLFGIFSYTNWRFRKDKNDLAPANGVHFAWNLLKLGLKILS